MKHSNKLSAQLILKKLTSNSVENIVISPGSRNAPLVIEALTYSNLNLHSIIDERSAGFVALGIALATKKPTSLFCTSGSALLNYAPALAEAYYMKVPLIVVSADRPKHLIEMADGQTINQVGSLSNVVKSEAVIEDELNEEQSQIQISELLDNLFRKSISHPQGPVHLNIHFDEPLYEFMDAYDFDSLGKPLKEQEESGVEKNIGEVDKLFKSNFKTILLVGQGVLNKLELETIHLLAKENKALVLYETTSNLKLIDGVGAIDVFLEGLPQKEKLKLQPDLLVTYKTNVISKKVKVWLRDSNLKYHLHIGSEHLLLDTFQKLTHQIKGSISQFPVSKWKTHTEFVKKGKNKFNEISLKAKNFVSNFSDFYVFNFLSKNLPKDEILIVGNSAPIRYVQLFEGFHFLENHCNRGTSGIEGTISTAVGISLANPKKEITVIIGDISFFYDSNAFFNSEFPKNLKIILINNSGGGIFKIIEGPNKVNNHEKYIETQHEFNAKGLSKTYGFSYFEAFNETELKHSFKLLKKESKAAVLEVFTPKAKNDEVLKGFFQFIKSKPIYK